MKYLLFSFALLLPTFKGNGQQLGTDKIESQYFQNLARFDTCEVVVLSDNARLNFIYRDNYLGAVDESFSAQLTKEIRMKVNHTKSLPHGRLTIAKIADSISIDEIKVTELTVYHYKAGKVLKDKMKTNSAGISLAKGVILLDLNSMAIRDGDIVDFSYVIKDVSKKNQRWNIGYPYYSASASLEVNIPEIYVYHHEIINPSNLRIGHNMKNSHGILVGYYAPNIGRQHKLITPAYYKAMKERDAEVNKATKVYCGYTTHRFDVQNVFPVADAANCAYIDFKLITVNPIVY